MEKQFYLANETRKEYLKILRSTVFGSTQTGSTEEKQFSEAEKNKRFTYTSVWVIASAT
jgi:hypothetical protein